MRFTQTIYFLKHPIDYNNGSAKISFDPSYLFSFFLLCHICATKPLFARRVGGIQKKYAINYGEQSAANANPKSIYPLDALLRQFRVSCVSKLGPFPGPFLDRPIPPVAAISILTNFCHDDSFWFRWGFHVPIFFVN